MKGLTHLKDFYFKKVLLGALGSHGPLEKCFLGLANQEHLHDSRLQSFSERGKTLLKWAADPGKRKARITAQRFLLSLPDRRPETC